ncbi:MAG: glycosyltransferase family 4 protein [Kiritimatiellaeota bacterium]|nr:glycosyltransferase family 4 protein [Kiritimatiellota bacterium]
MKVAFLYNSTRIIGGGEIGFTELIRRALEVPDIDPLVLVPGPGEVSARLDKLGVVYRLFSLPGLRGAGVRHWPPITRRLAALMRAEECRVIHANGARCMLYAGAAGRLAGIPVLWHVRVLERDRRLDHVRSLLARRIVCNSRAVAATLKPYLTASRKTTVIYNGVDQAPFRTARPANLHAEFGIPGERRIVLVAALLVEWKGQRDVVEALALLPKGVRRAVHVVFAGRELTPGQPFTTELRQLARRNEVDGHISWAGHRNDLPAVMRGADLLLLPSHGEPFGRVIAEAWAAGLPVAATGSGGPAEIVEHGETGWLFREKSPSAVAASISTLLRQPTLLKRLAENGQKRAEDFTLEKHAEALFRCYRDLARTPHDDDSDQPG